MNLSDYSDYVINDSTNKYDPFLYNMFYNTSYNDRTNLTDAALVASYAVSQALSNAWVNSKENLSKFYASSWQSGDWPVPMLIVRLILLVFALVILSWSIISAFNVYWLLFLTNWGMALVTAMCLAGVVVSIQAVRGDLSDKEEVPPWYVGAYWLLYNISIGMAFVISLLYWTLLFSPELLKDPLMFYLEFLNHAGNSFIVLVEVLVSRTPMRPEHVYQPLVVGLWYALFTAIYYLAGGTDSNGVHFIYDLLDWKHTKRTSLIVFLAMVAMVILYFIIYGVVLTRDILSFKIRTTSYNLGAGVVKRY